MSLAALGWNDNIGECDEELARVIVVDRDRCVVASDTAEVAAQLSGKFRYCSGERDAYPCVGDWVCIKTQAGAPLASIERVLPRKTFLRRKSAGNNIEYQMIAANIDVAFIVQSCHFDFNVRRLERYLVMINEGNVEPVIILTKTDLISQDALNDLVEKIRYMRIDVAIMMVSNVTGAGIEEVRGSMVPGKTYCLVGSSGVGKTTLINRLTGHSALETRPVSATGEGRHTTVRRQLILLANGSLLIDTPGMRELGIAGAASGIEVSYQDITALARDCRFANCSHSNEPGCAVQKALKENRLDEEHYNNYLKIKKESDFFEMSYVEKRKKDKDFGKMIRRVKQQKKRDE